MNGYRQLLAVPGLAPLLAVSLLARIAITADVMALTMYVVLGLRMSYAAAGGVAATLTVGLALGGPLLGRAIDRRGLRPVVLTTVAVQAVLWLSVPALPYGGLLVAAFVAGTLTVPAQPVTRQAIAAMTTTGQRRTAFALESVQGELSYMVGPALVILCAAQLSPRAVAWSVGAALVAGGIGIALLDPPLRAVGEEPRAATGRLPVRRWLGAGMVAVLLMAFGTTMLLSGVDLAIVATLEDAGQVSRAALVVAVFGVSSVVGGLIYGALTRNPPTWLLLGLLGLAIAPAGIARDWPWLCVAMVAAGLLTAPTLTALTGAVSRLAPPGVRGEATGLQSSALSAGFALGSPLVGAVVDALAPPAGFAAAALAAVTAAATGYALTRRFPPRTPSPAGSGAAPHSGVGSEVGKAGRA